MWGDKNCAGGSSMKKLILKIKMKHEEKMHRCNKCGKTFSSGKALGGHMSSAHVQSSKPRPIECSKCNKVFWTDKSLYGHMRTHPKRRAKALSPSCLWSWPRSFKRCRSVLVSDSETETEDERIATAVEVLASMFGTITAVNDVGEDISVAPAEVDEEEDTLVAPAEVRDDDDAPVEVDDEEEEVKCERGFDLNKLIDEQVFRDVNPIG